MSTLPAVTSDALLAHRGFIVKLARELVHDESLAEDLAQTTYLQALRKPPRHGVNLRAWLALAVRNCARQFYRGERRRQAREQKAAVPESVPSSSELAAELQTQRMVLDAVDALPEPYKSVVMLRFFRDMPPREIARLKGVPVATVNSQLARAIHRLRRQLDAAHGSDRGAWLMALTLGQPLSTAVPLVAAGVFGMKMKGLIVAGAAALVGLFVYTVGGLSGEGDVPIVVAGEDPAPLTAPGTSPAPLDLGRTGLPVGGEPRRSAPGVATFRGLVLDVAGNPVDAVQLSISDSEQGVVSDSEGAFHMPVPGKTVRIVVDDPALATVLAATVGPGVVRQEEPPVVVVASKIDLRGIVVDDLAAPLDGVRLSCRLPGDFHARFTQALDTSHSISVDVHTSSDGMFEIPDLGRVTGATMRVTKNGFLPLTLPQPDVSRDDLRVELKRPEPRPGNLQGQVLDSFGVPVEGARVCVGWAGTVSDAEGMFILSLRQARGRRDVTAMVRGFLPAFHTIDLDPETTEESHVEFVYLRLGEETKTISGTVVDEEGSPRPGARVWASEPEIFGIMDNGFITVESYLAGGLTEVEMKEQVSEAERAVDGWRGFRSSALWAYATADRDGRFELTGLLDREYKLGVMAPGSGARTETDPMLAGTANARLVLSSDLILPLVAGQVLAPDGTPIAGAKVRGEARSITVRYIDRNADLTTGVPVVIGPVTTDENGRFAFRNLAKTVRLDVSGEEILNTSFGTGVDDLRQMGSDPVDALRLTVSRRVRLRVELADPQLADAIGVLNGAGEEEMIHKFSGGIIGSMNKINLHNGRSEVCSVAEDVNTVVLFRDREEVARIPVVLELGRINVVTR